MISYLAAIQMAAMENLRLLIEIIEKWFYAWLVMEIIKELQGQHKMCRIMIGDPWT